MKIKNNLILAMDIMELKQAEKVCETIGNQIDTIKIGYPLTLAEGIKTIKIFKENYNYQIICDYKVADIPATNSKIAEQTFKNGADGIITHGFVGEDSVKACQDKANEYNKDLFLLTEMSHPGAKRFLQKDADEIAKMGVEMGIKNYVAPATRINRLKEIREIVGKDSFIISPGVGKQGGEAKKTLEYANAIIVGRSIYESENPKKTTEDIIKSTK